ncbi:hypothetical protein A1A1_18272 [Planococcus antarcticus DSM 14505]|uniref:Zinc-ribbon domain-containing protein n=1 Tax=Planococcus antarcticus DSM 14505 TaxID=1185653 RepID=A0A1C7DHK4_9BACL|nr:hypothetical protein BBH88_11820 [Planococcus antarcticus DSM 14505]EIM05037.1 hypothetical protein A1A1_18272 [Planococcus antarcticus DSM 14505]
MSGIFSYVCNRNWNAAPNLKKMKNRCWLCRNATMHRTMRELNQFSFATEGGDKLKMLYFKKRLELM